MSLIYYYPNRPTLVPPDPINPLKPKPDYINGLEKSGLYIAEKKYNGENAMLFTDTGIFFNRNRTRLNYKPSIEMLDELSKLPKGCLFNGELMHNKTKSIKNLFIVHCIMVWEEEPLIGKTWGYSRELLETLTYGEHVILSPIWKEGFWDLWKEADGETVEGIILKNPSGILKLSTSPVPDVSWMLKIRHPTKNYSF